MIDLKDPRQPQANGAVPSIAAGMRWAAGCVPGRIHRLHAIAGINIDAHALRRAGASSAAWAPDRRADDRNKPVAVASDDG